VPGSGSAAATFKVNPMTHDAPQSALSTSNDAPAFPHTDAPQPPLEPAERQYAERPRGVPNWHPEVGDFN
jgi:hypothetical protein